jgi:restriction system protein
MTFVPSPGLAASNRPHGRPADGSQEARPFGEAADLRDDFRPTARSRGAILMKAALEALDRAGGAMTSREMLAEVPLRVQLIPSDFEASRKSGKLRWRTLLHLSSIVFARAGFIRKHRGRWELPPEGRALLTLPAEELLDKATQRYKDWKAGRSVARRSDSTGGAASADEASGRSGPGADLVSAFVADAGACGMVAANAAPVDAAPAGAPLAHAALLRPANRSLLLETAKRYARTEIEGFVNAMAPYDFQDLVASLLRAMDYTISFVSSRGVDGGTDILAYPDPLGARTPHIRVQVKHREDKATREEVAALQGIIRPGREIGLFVSSGGFTSGAVREARHGATHIELMDWDGVLDKWLALYKRMPKADRRRLRLRPVYFLASG